MTRPKPTPNRDRYMQTLRSMSPEQRLAKAFELSEMSREALMVGIIRRYPHLSEAQRAELFVERIERCRSRNC